MRPSRVIACIADVERRVHARGGAQPSIAEPSRTPSASCGTAIGMPSASACVWHQRGFRALPPEAINRSTARPRAANASTMWRVAYASACSAARYQRARSSRPRAASSRRRRRATSDRPAARDCRARWAADADRASVPERVLRPSRSVRRARARRTCASPACVSRVRAQHVVEKRARRGDTGFEQPLARQQRFVVRPPHAGTEVPAGAVAR